MTVKVLKIDENCNIVRENGDFVWLYNDDAVTQLVAQRLRVFKNEWFLNLDLGIDYYGIVFTKGSTEFAIYIEFKRVVESVKGVVELLDFSIEPINIDRRQFRIKMNILSDYGSININEVL